MRFFRTITIAVIMMGSWSLHSMEFKSPLSEIEKQLILREVAARGKGKILLDIHKEREVKCGYDEERDCSYINAPVIVKIVATFDKKQRETDPVVSNIFTAIEAIEKEEGYCSKLRMVQRDGYREGLRPTNHLGESTRYFWVKDNESVKIRSHFIDKNALLEVVDHYNE